MRVIAISYGYVNYTIPLANELAKIINGEIYLMEPAYINKYQSLISKEVKLLVFQNRYRIRNPLNIIDIYQLLKTIRGIKPEIIHIQRGFPWLNIALPLIKNTKIVTTIHDVHRHPGDRDSRKIPSFIQDLIVKHSDHIIVHGKHMYRQIVEKYQMAESKIDIVNRGDYADFYDFQAVKAKNDLSGKKIVLFFGRIWEYKGLKYLIEAQPYISKEIPDARIMIAGSGEEFGAYQALIKDNKAFIIYNTHVPNEEVADLFKKSSVVVLPYIEASQTGVIPLAYSYGKPVVVTNVGSLPEIVENGKTGFVVEPRDAKALAKAIIDILKDEDLQRNMGRNGYAMVKNELSWSNAARKTYDIYKRVLAAPD